MDASQPAYNPPLVLTVISSISIGIAGLAALWILLDIIHRRGWKSMMLIMIPVYVVNALYLWPITLWTYLLYGRPKRSKPGEAIPSHCAHHPPHANNGGETDVQHTTAGGVSDRGASSSADRSCEEQGSSQNVDIAHSSQEGKQGHQHHHGGTGRPMFATVTVAVCHCGAGCVIGDIIGEWLVFGTNATIDGRTLWPEYIIDFAWAIALGVFFQYFSIAPMAGEYGPKTLYRALKADFISLLFFEIGLFGWMAIFQIAIFRWRLEMNTVTYWWMMQIGMFCGHWTAVPINYWLIKARVKEPCA